MLYKRCVPAGIKASMIKQRHDKITMEFYLENSQQLKAVIQFCKKTSCEMPNGDQSKKNT